jgi:hypothetical protein
MKTVSVPLEKLQRCAERIEHGAWQLIRLRGTTSMVEMIDQDDVDLLGSRAEFHRLLDAAYSWVRANECHIRVTASSNDKISLYLISLDGIHRLTLDLWINLWQIDRRRKSLNFDQCISACTPAHNALLRLPPLLETSVFIHHLICKKKDCSSPKQIARMQHYQQLCANMDEKIVSLLGQAIQSRSINHELESHTLKRLEKELNFASKSTFAFHAHRLINALPRIWHHVPKKLIMISIMGCDGSGKTTLSRQLKSLDQVVRLYTGKHLYRKWIIYKLLVIFLRPLLLQKREKFDDTLAPLIYVLACIRLWWKRIFHRKGITLIDRSIVDFLMLDRKSDRPHFSRWLCLTKLIGIRLPHIQVIVSFEQLRERKLEMTEAGHPIYDELMFRHFAHRFPTDHTVFSNQSTLENAATAMQHIVAWLKMRG